MQSEISIYFESICIGPTFIINLNPEPYNSIFLLKNTLRKLSVKKVQRGVKYHYWSNKVTLIGKGKIMEVYINNDTILNNLIIYFSNELPKVVIER